MVLTVIPALIGLYLLLVRRKRNRNRQVGQTMFDLVIPRDRTWLRHVAVGLSILSLLTLTLAFAKPKDQVAVPRERATIVVTIDMSLSMEATDVQPNRLDAAKAGAEHFVQSLPPKFNVALVVLRGLGGDAGPADPGPGRRHGRHPGPAAAGVHRHRRGHLHLVGRAVPGPARPEQPQRRPTCPDRPAQRRQDPGRSSIRPGRPCGGGPVPIYTIAYGTADGYIDIGGRREPVPVDRAELARIRGSPAVRRTQRPRPVS